MIGKKTYDKIYDHKRLKDKLLLSYFVDPPCQDP